MLAQEVFIFWIEYRRFQFLCLNNNYTTSFWLMPIHAHLLVQLLVSEEPAPVLQ